MAKLDKKYTKTPVAVWSMLKAFLQEVMHVISGFNASRRARKVLVTLPGQTSNTFKNKNMIRQMRIIQNNNFSLNQAKYSASVEDNIVIKKYLLLAFDINISKVCILKSNVLSVLLFRAESWKVTKSVCQRLKASTCLKRILGIYRPNKISNYELRTEEDRRMPLIAVTREAMRRIPDGKRKRERPRRTH